VISDRREAAGRPKRRVYGGFALLQGGRTVVTLLICTRDARGARDVEGVIWLEYDPARMDVRAEYPKEGSPLRREVEPANLVRAAAALAAWTSVSRAEALTMVRSEETHQVEVAPGAAQRMRA
jgi:hypothetical protein